MYQRSSQDTSLATAVLFRIVLVLTFIILIVRLFQLQILQGAPFQEAADANRFRLVEVAPQRGVIYDRNGKILTRNRPSFEIALVPEDIPLDDDLTEDIDEEAQEIEKVLMVLHADTNTDVALRIAELMFRNLGRVDYAKTLEEQEIKVEYISVPDGSQRLTPLDTDLLGDNVGQIELPDISIPLPLHGLVALVQRSINFKRQGSASEPVPILDLVEPFQAFDIEEEIYRLSSVRVRPVPVRDYPRGELVSHVLGFMGPIPAFFAETYKENGYNDPNERVGLNGLEYSYQDELRGAPGTKIVEVDILGREQRDVGESIAPVPGANLHLSLDLYLQEVMFNELSAMMEETEAPWGVTIAMDPRTGSVLGMVSLPSFDNNIFAERINDEYLALEKDERKPLINYAIGGLYPPGSTYKIVTAAAALNEDVVVEGTTIVDNGPIFLPNKFFPDDPSQAQKFVSWNHALGIVHGPVDVVDALALSNDIYFYIVAGGYPPTDFKGIGNQKLSEWSALFGYGDPTGIDLPGEVEATIPNAQWKRQRLAESWTTGDSYNMSIGQGFFLSTPLQVLVSIAAVANGGTVLQPQLVYQVVDSEGGLQRDFTPRVVQELPLKEGVMESVQKGMWAVMNTPAGTGAFHRLDDIVMAGKTGTAEFCDYIPEEEDCRRDEEDNLPTHAWFVAYAPFENPEIAVVTFLYDGGEGSAAAAPVTKAILEAYFSGPIEQEVEETN